MEVLKEYAREKGELFYDDIEQFRKIEKGLVIFLPYLPVSLFSYLKNISDFFLNLKFLVLSREYFESMYSLL